MRLKGTDGDIKVVVDADGPLTLRVKKADVDIANPAQPDSCALAQCAQRVLSKDGLVGSRFGAEVVYLEYDNRFVRFFLREEDAQMIRAFDYTGQSGHAPFFRAGAYTLMPPPPSRRIGTRRGEVQGSNRREGRVKSVRNVPSLRHVFTGAS